MPADLINNLGGASGFGTGFLGPNDDSSTDLLSILSIFENGLNFFGTTYSGLFINNNGGVTFETALSEFTPQVISNGTIAGIFAYWADVDTRTPVETSVFPTPGGTSTGENLLEYSFDVANDRLVMTWNDVGYFSQHVDLLNAFQLILTDRSDAPGRALGDFDITFRYEAINWTTGDASGGDGGLFGTPARAGYASGGEAFFELPVSGNQEELLSLEDTAGNTGEDGVWQFEVRNGAVVENMPPVAVDDTVPGFEDVTVRFSVLGNDFDPDGDTITILSVTDGAFGQASIFDPVAGSLEYLPDPNFFGVDSFTYTISDGRGGVDTAVVTVNVQGFFDSPIAVDDQTDGVEETPLDINVLANDSDPDGTPLFLSNITQGTGGTASIAGNGIVSFTPDVNFNGTATFEYEVTNGNDRTDTAIVNIFLENTLDAPIAFNDQAVGEAETPLEIEVLGNDIDPDDLDGDGSELVILAATDGAFGATFVTVDGTIIYSPDPEFVGSDTFTYRIANAAGLVDIGQVFVTIEEGNGDPVALDLTSEIRQNVGVLFEFNEGVFFDPDGDPVTLTDVSDPQNGSAVAGQNPNSITFTPDPDFVGVEQLIYTISDGQGGSDTGTLTITVVANGLPVAVNDSFLGTEDVSLIIDMLRNDSDPDGDPISLSGFDASNGRSLTAQQDGTFLYTPPADFFGIDSFSYEITDSFGGTASAIISVDLSPVPDDPVAADDTILLDEDNNATFDVLLNDNDPDGDPLTITSTGNAGFGSVTLNAEQSITYTPDPNFFGSDSFVYEISDGTGRSATATVFLEVRPVFDFPTAVDDTAITNEGIPISIDVVGNDIDLDGDPLFAELNGDGLLAPLNGSVQLSEGGNIIYTPGTGFVGTDQFEYLVRDSGELADIGLVTVAVGDIPEAPIAMDDVFEVLEDLISTLDVRVNDSDPDGDPLTVLSVSTAANGATAIGPNGAVSYTPNADFFGLDSFTYSIGDGTGLADSATVSLTVVAVNDDPIAAADLAQTLQGQSVDIDVLLNDSDIDSDIRVNALGAAGFGTVAVLPDGSIRYTPSPDFLGLDQFSYSLTDDEGGSATAEVEVQVLQEDDFLPELLFPSTAQGFGVIDVGATQTGTINYVGDADWFEVSLQAGRVYEIRMTGLSFEGPATLDPFLEGVSVLPLGGPGPVLIGGSSNDDEIQGDIVLPDSRVLFSTSVTGLHAIQAGAFGSTTGDYSLEISDQGLFDDFGADPFTLGEVAADGVTQGTFEFSGDRDWFEVTLTAGQRYAVRLDGRDGALLGEGLGIEGLHDALGDLIPNTTGVAVRAGPNDPNNPNAVLYEELIFTPTESGTFYVASGADTQTTGTYEVSVDAIAPEDPSFNIQLDFLGGDAFADLHQYFLAAADRWEEVIRGDLPSANIEGIGHVEDIRIRIDFVNDATLAFPGVTSDVRAVTFISAERSDDAGVLPYAADISVGQDFGRGLGVYLEDLAVNAIGRGLGFGLLWDRNGLLEDSQGGLSYVGTNALREFQSMSGLPGDILLSDGSSGGLAGEYWNEGTFTYDANSTTRYSEVMSSLFTYPLNSGLTAFNVLSRATIGAMDDLGYQVSYRAADSFGPQVFQGTTQPSMSSPGLELDGQGGVALQGSDASTAAVNARLAQMTFDQLLTAYGEDFAPLLDQSFTLTNANASITAFNGSSFNIFETVTGENFILLVEGDFEQNAPSNLLDVQGTVTSVTVFSRFGQQLLQVDNFPKTTFIQNILSDILPVDFATANFILNDSGGTSTISINAAGAVTSAISAISAGTGDDFVLGNREAEVINGGAGHDLIHGGEGNDTVTGGTGNDLIVGGEGDDTALLSGAQSNYTLTLTPNSTTLEDRRAVGDGRDDLFELEFLDFSENILGNPFNLTKFGGPAALSEDDLSTFIEMYIAYFNRAPDAVGLFFWATAFQNGLTLEEIAEQFITQPETSATYPDGTSNIAFAESVYDNVLGRIPDQSGLLFWVGALDGGAVTRATFILEVLRGAKSDLKPENGEDFVAQQIADQAYLQNKTDIGTYFAVIKGMSDTADARSVMQLFEGTDTSINAAVSAADTAFASASDAVTGDFLMPLIGVLSDPFEI